MPSLHKIKREGKKLKAVYPICCGVDVHKKFFVATLIVTQGLLPQYVKKRFSTFNNQILEFKKWLLENNCRDVSMELREILGSRVQFTSRFHQCHHCKSQMGQGGKW